MRKRFFLVICLGFFCSLYAQSPVLTKNTLVSFGTVWEMADADPLSLSAIDVSIKGENAVWDFSRLKNQNENTKIHIYYKDPVETESYSDFPDANFVAVEEDYNAGNLIYSKYSYYKVTNDKMEKVGYKYLNESIVSYNDYQMEMTFPMQYGSTGNDTWDNSGSSFGGGEVDFECVGYGTLILPDATYQNVLMVYYVATEDFFENEMYAWYAEDGTTLLQYNLPFFFLASPSALYALKQVPSGNENMQNIAESVNYSNPVEDMLNVKIETKNSSLLNFMLTSTSGNIVLQKDSPSFQGINSFDFDMSNLSAGVYFLTVNSADSNKPLTLKVIKK